MRGPENSRYDAAPRQDARRPLRLECRECEAVCEQVVSPWRCLTSGCTYIYSYEGEDAVYFGCLCKVFAPELDLAAFTDGHGRPARGPDPYGTLKVVRTPRPQCPVRIERAYDIAGEGPGCSNRGFLHGSLRRG